jgi:GNAT superfamily N-acetyltransferase
LGEAVGVTAMAWLREILGLGAGATPAAHDRIEARPIGPADECFLRDLYAEMRADEMRATGWPESRCRAFLDQQFDFQQRTYRAQHADAQFLLLVLDGQPLGRLYWRSEPARATLIDLSLASRWRGCGIGSTVLRWLTEAADRRGQSIALHIDPRNPALALLRRFGFEAEDDNNVYLRMQRLPSAPG